MINSCFMRCGQCIGKGQTFYRTVLITCFYLLNDKMDIGHASCKENGPEQQFFLLKMFQIIWMDRPFEKRIV